MKPTNVLIGFPEGGNLNNPFVKICDFGMSACTKSSASVWSTMKTAMYCIVGSYPYMAPEVLVDFKKTPYNEFCDIWSLSATLFSCFPRKKFG